MSQRSVWEYPEGCILLFEGMGMRAVATQVPKPKTTEYSNMTYCHSPA
jgi:hypothetical protein